MVNKPKQIGTAAETAVTRYLVRNGFPKAERRALMGEYDQGDINTGDRRIVIEVKGGNAAKTASDNQIAAWLVETDTERVNARAQVGVLVLQRAGVGAPNAGRWWAVVPSAALTVLCDPSSAYAYDAPVVPVRLTLADTVQLLRWAGYGEPLEDEAA